MILRELFEDKPIKKLKINESESDYTSLKDIYAPGDTQVWFTKPVYRNVLSQGIKAAEKNNLTIDTNNLEKTHILVGTVDKTDPKTVYALMQGEIWSPQGEAALMIRRLGLSHTSMSVGDIIKTKDNIYFVDKNEIIELPNVEPAKESILTLESSHPLFESVLPVFHKQVILGEQLAHALNEIALTPDVIEKLFAQVQNQTTAKGSNRTVLGKGVDAAQTVAKAYAGLKELAQNSGPVRGFDAAFDRVAEQLKQYTGGDKGAMRYVEKYRDFAKKYPISQKVIYGALVMAVGVASAGALGPAGLVLKPAVIGLMRTTDRLLQGEKFSTAAISGAETFAAGKVAQWAGQGIRNIIGGGTAAPADALTSTATDAASTAPLTFGQSVRKGLALMKELASSGEITDYNSFQKALRDVSLDLAKNNNLGGVNQLEMLKTQINRLVNIEASEGQNLQGNANTFIKRFIELNGGTPNQAAFAQGDAFIQQMAQAGAIDQSGAVAGNVLQPPASIRSDPALSDAYNKIVARMQANPDYKTFNLQADIQRFAPSVSSVGGANAAQSALSLQIQQAGGGSMQGFINAVKAAGGARQKVEFDKVDLSIPALTESQIKTIFQQIEEGPLDRIKQAGSKIASNIKQKVATGAENLTNKITANKLMRAWKAAGSTVDSDELYQFLLKQGVDQSVVDAVYNSAGIPEPTTQDYINVSTMIGKLQLADKQKLIQYLQQELATA